jgi:hypothetical protein
LIAKDRPKLHPLKAMLFNDISLKQVGGWPNPPSEKRLLMVLSAEDMTPIGIAVKLVCPIVSLPTEPYLVPLGGTYQSEVRKSNAGSFGSIP